MFTAILKRNSWLIYKVGMPLVYLYHALLSNVFLNTAADDAQGLERIANIALMPIQYLLEGKKAILVIDGDGNVSYQLSQRFDYEHHFYLKTAVATSSLPVSLVVGGALKTLSYTFPETRQRAKKLKEAVVSTKAQSNQTYYDSLGLKVNDYRKADHIAPPKWKRRPRTENPLKHDIEALKEVISILSENQICFWIDRGSCLGTYQYGGAIPSDWDVDIAVLQPDFAAVKNALHALDPEKYVVQDWSGRQFPGSYLKVFVKESGGLIDIFHFAIDSQNQQIYTLFSNQFNIFAPESWMTREKRYTKPMPFAYIFPLKRGSYEGISVPVPGQIEKYLQVFYGENLAPAWVYSEVTGNYEKDVTHPYWKLPSAH
ncbi:MAG: LicD family protein [Verrucomicrobia bacterium]|nr:LicD family protein [Verrucomicrobiota bacterium]